MQTIVPESVVKKTDKIYFKPSFEHSESNYAHGEQILDYDLKIETLFLTLSKKGLDRLTDSKIEHVMCTSALAAFN